MNKYYLKLQIKDNYQRFKYVPILVGIVCLVFVARNFYLLLSPHANSLTSYFLTTWLFGLVFCVVGLIKFKFLYRIKDLKKLDAALYVFVLSMCTIAGILSALDSRLESNLTVYGFSVTGAAMAYRTSIKRYVFILGTAAVAYLVMHVGILNGPINFNIIAPLASISVLATFISTSLEKNTKQLIMLTSELEQANQRLIQDTIKDHMTSLYNRRYLNDVLPREIAKFERTGDHLCLAMCDLDFFKSINDDYGHLVGDQVLIEFASILLEQSRTTDIVIRYGGEEFLIIMPCSVMPWAQTLVKRIQQALELHQFNRVHKKLTASFGVTQIREGDTLDSLLSRTDKLLYEAKESGRNCVKSDFS